MSNTKKDKVYDVYLVSVLNHQNQESKNEKYTCIVAVKYEFNRDILLRKTMLSLPELQWMFGDTITFLTLFPPNRYPLLHLRLSLDPTPTPIEMRQQIETWPMDDNTLRAYLSPQSSSLVQSSSKRK